MLSRLDERDFEPALDDQLARWQDEQLFEEDVRTVLNLFRPHRAERLLGWNEYRTGGEGFRATISWDTKQKQAIGSCSSNSGNTGGGGSGQQIPADAHFVVPQMTNVLESILVGSIKNADDLAAAQEFEIYRQVIRELHRRLDEMQRCYE